MAIKRTLRRITKVTRQLVDADPTFVSIVDHGANQTPFAVIKVAKPQELDMLTKTSKKNGDTTKVQIQRMTFAKAQFADEAAVKAYLTANGYDADVVADGEVGFVCKAHEEGAFEGALSAIPAAEGVVVYGGTLKDEPSAEGETKKTADAPGFTMDGMAAPELIQKYDAYMAMYSDGRTIEEVMSTGNDGLPPGLSELGSAFSTALRNIVLGGADATAVTALCTEFGVIINNVVAVFRNALVPGEEALKALDSKPVVTKTEEQPALTEGKPEDTVVEEVKTEDTHIIEEATKSSDLAEMMKPITTVLTSLSAAVLALTEAQKSVQKETTDAILTIKEEVGKVAVRVEAVETSGQTRKGVDTVETKTNDEPVVTQDEDKEHSIKMRNNILGFGRRN